MGGEEGAYATEPKRKYFANMMGFKKGVLGSESASTFVEQKSILATKLKSVMWLISDDWQGN